VLCAVELVNSETAKTIFKLNCLFNALIKVEEKRKSVFPVYAKTVNATVIQKTTVVVNRVVSDVLATTTLNFALCQKMRPLDV